MNLVIVESAAKCKTISKYLNKPDIVKRFGTFEVVASNGHVRDLVKKKTGTDCGIDVDKWVAHYEGIPGKSKVIQNLAKRIKEAKTVWLAADLDREGEAIAWHVKEMFRLKEYKRISFNEITESALKQAIMASRQIDFDLVDAQQSRRMLDRLIGFKLTQLLWKNFNGTGLMTAGRVQSVLLAIICEVEKKAFDFQTTRYFTLCSDFTIGKIAINGCKVCDPNGILDFENEEVVMEYLKRLTRAKFSLDETKILNRNETPPPPFITSTLQQEAYSKLGFSSKTTMKIAQELYEAGKITYMRTDSTKLSNEAKETIKKYISNELNCQFVDRTFKSKSKNAQEAHEAIRPSKFLSQSQVDTSTMNHEQKKLYVLIFKRCVASMMESATFEELNVKIGHSLERKTHFLGKTSVLTRPGYKALYGFNAHNGLRSTLESIQKQEDAPKGLTCIARTTWRRPPVRLNEPNVIKLLEKEGIGRPSTYSSILQKLFERQFIEKRNIEGESKEYTEYKLTFRENTIEKSSKARPFFKEMAVICPTAAGLKVNEFLLKHFSAIINTKFTALMEDDLDSIANGKKKMAAVMESFYLPFMKEYAGHVKVSGCKIDAGNISKGIEYNIKGKLFTVRNAKFGPVIQDGSNYISLKQYLLDTKKTIDNISEKDVALLTSLPINIGDDVLLKYGRYGFYMQSETNAKTRRIFKNELDSIFTNDLASLRSKMKIK